MDKQIAKYLGWFCFTLNNLKVSKPRVFRLVTLLLSIFSSDYTHQKENKKQTITHLRIWYSPTGGGGHGVCHMVWILFHMLLVIYEIGNLSESTCQGQYIYPVILRIVGFWIAPHFVGKYMKILGSLARSPWLSQGTWNFNKHPPSWKFNSEFTPQKKMGLEDDPASFWGKRPIFSVHIAATSKEQSSGGIASAHLGSISHGKKLQPIDPGGIKPTSRFTPSLCGVSNNISHDGSMGLVYLPTWMVDVYGKLVGEYTVRPMDAMGIDSYFRRDFFRYSRQNIEGSMVYIILDIKSSKYIYMIYSAIYTIHLHTLKIYTVPW